MTSKKNYDFTFRIVIQGIRRMPPITVFPVVTKAQQKRFLELPWKIYQGNEFWVPPLRMDQKEMVGYAKHPFYFVNQAQTFLAERDGKPVGRISAIINTAHNERYGERRGFFGFFESIDDNEVAGKLFDAAAAWLRERGMTDLRGPCSPSQNYECGLLIEGFDIVPTFMMPYNHPYYQNLCEDYGFQKTQDLISFWGHVDMMETLDKKMGFVIEEAKRRFDINLRPINKHKFVEEVAMFLDIYNKSLVGTWGFAPLSDGEIQSLAAALRFLIVPEMTSVAEVDGKPIGAVFGLLDYNPRVKQIDGKLFPFGFLKLLMNKRAIKRVRLVSTNVLPEYQRWGVGLVLMSRLVPEIFNWGIEIAEFSWVLESNHLSRATLERGGAKIDKMYRLYDKSLV